INGQSKNATVKDIKYGKKTISYNGCELLAVYNAMILIGNEQSFVDIKNKAETTPRVMWLNGRWGSRPKELGKLFDGFEQKYNVITNKKKFNDSLKDGGVYIISYWTSLKLLSPIHTVAFTCDAEMNIIVYNRYSNITIPYKYDAIAHKTGLDRFLDETGAPIVMYEVLSEEAK
ncbi:MAG: hypothetical protein IJF74_00145, partial [Clostridia bacterium]|nr:hypothetical protein [Clostridia bacterium]